MKKVTMETNYKEIQSQAKELGLKFVGVKKELLVNQINEALEAQAKSEEPKKSGKWFDQEGAFPFQSGDLAIITNINKHQFLVGRMVQITRPSAKKNSVKAYLINEKTGALQGTEITLEFGYIELYIPQLPAIIPSHIIA